MDTQGFHKEYGVHLKALAKQEPLGLYLHVPFCKDRCTYCSFVRTSEEENRDLFIQTLTKEVQQWGQALDRPTINTIYWGGGTPSILSESEVAHIAGVIHEYFQIEPSSEQTIEANPGALSLEWLKCIQGLGFNRISWGVQTLHDDLLNALGRIHSSEQALQALGWSKQAGFSHISADLILGLPNQSPESVYVDALKMINHGVDHISIYLLDLDKACALKTEVEAGRLILPNEDQVASLYEILQDQLPRLGFTPYEISNYSKQEAQSRHNQKYWRRHPYLGLGPSAASHLGPYRWTSDLSITAWNQGRGQLTLEVLDPVDEWMEIPLLGLRLDEGIDWNELSMKASHLNVVPLFHSWTHQMKHFEMAGLVIFEDSKVRLTTKGRLLSNEIFQIFV